MSFPFPFLLFFFFFPRVFHAADEEGISSKPRVARTERKSDAPHTPTFLAITIIMVLGRGSKRRGRWIVSASWVRVHVAGVCVFFCGR